MVRQVWGHWLVEKAGQLGAWWHWTPRHSTRRVTFRHGSEAEVTVARDTHGDTAAGGGSQHSGLYHNLGALDVALALDHPELQLRGAWLLPLSSLGLGTPDGSLQDMVHG